MATTRTKTYVEESRAGPIQSFVHFGDFTITKPLPEVAIETAEATSRLG